MRIRDRNVSNKLSSWAGNSAIAYTHTFCDGSTPVSGTDYSQPGHSNLIFDAVYERISDATGRGESHPCLHRTWKYVVDDTAGDQAFGSSKNSKFSTFATVGMAPYWHRYYHGMCTGTFGWNTANNLVPPFWSIANTSINENILKENAIEKARQLKADVLLNLVEANQAWPAVRSLATSLPVMARNWKNMRQLVKTASGSYLAWKFGVSPILQDMMAIHRYLPKLRDDIKRHGDREAQRFSSQGEMPMSFSYIDPAPYVLNGYECAKWIASGRVLKAPTVRYVLVVKPTTKYHTEFFKNLDGFMSRFATSPASLAWEKIPFSFVVDWFVDLRGVLRTLDNLVGFNPFTVVSFTRSYGYHVNTDASYPLRTACGGGLTSGGHAFSSEYKHYERTLVSMGPSAPEWKVRFGKNQAGISAALISQQLSKTAASWRFGTKIG